MTLFSLALRHSRRLSTAASTAAPAATTKKPPSISRLKSKLKTARDPDEALKIYNSFVSVSDPSSSAASVRHAQEYTVRLLAKSGRLSDVEKFLESHKSSPHITQEYFLSSIIRSYGTVGMFENALKTYEQMTEFGTPRSALTFNSLLWACAQSKLFDRVVSYFDELPAKFGFSPDKFSYGILIKSYCELGSPETALEKLDEMQEKGIEVEAVVITTIFHSLHVNGRAQEAELFWDEMIKEKGFKPDVSSYNVKMHNVPHGDEESLKRLMEEMKSLGIKPDAITYSRIITFYCESGLVSVAKRAYDELLRQKGCNPSLPTFRTLVLHMCKIGRFVSAYKVFRKSVEQHKILEPDLLKWLAEGLVKKGHKGEAKSLIRTMKTRSPPKSAKDWVEFANSLGLDLDKTEEDDKAKTEEDDVAPDETKEIDSDKVEMGDSDKVEDDDSDSRETVNG